METVVVEISYDRKKILGSGVSVVYDGKYGDTPAAVKKIKLDKLQTTDNEDVTTLREIENQKKLSHENVLTIYAVKEDENFRYIALELCAGSLEDVIENKYIGPQLPVDRKVLYQIADGLDYVHSQRLVHRDIKPANILISSNSTIKISDFGLGKKIGTNSTCKMSGLRGTRLWMPPEFLGDERNIQTKGTKMSDIFPAGLVFFVFLTRHRGGVHPFGSKDNYLAVETNIKDNKLVNFEGLKCTGELIELILGMIQHEPEKRLSLEIVKQQLEISLEIRKIDIRSLMVEKIGGNEEIPSGDVMHVRFHPTESAAIIFCNKNLFVVKENNPQESFELWKWQKIDDVERDVYDLKWNADGSKFAISSSYKMPIYSYPKTTTNNEIGILKEMDIGYDNHILLDFAWNPFAINLLAVSFQEELPFRPRFSLWITDTQIKAPTHVKFRADNVYGFEWIGKNSFAVVTSMGLEQFEIRIYELNGSAPDDHIKTITRRNGLDPVTSLQWKAIFNILAVLSYKNLEIWEMGENDPILSLLLDAEKDWLSSIDWLPHDKHACDKRNDYSSMDILLACARRNGTIEIWKLNYADKSKQLMKSFNSPKSEREHVQVSFSPNGKYLSSWSEDELTIWDTKNFALCFKSLPMQFRMPPSLVEKNKIWDQTGTRIALTPFNFVYEIICDE